MRIALFLFCLIITSSSFAQEVFSISGSFSSDADDAVMYASVGLFNSSDSSLVKGTITNEEGEFIFLKIVEGSYYLSISHVQYEPFKKAIELSGNLQLNEIVLRQKVGELDELVVLGERDAIQNEIDRITIDPSQMLAGKGGSAVDVLRSIPIVNVSPDGGVSIRGSGDIQILINGKPSGMVVSQGPQFLQQLDASTIQAIEVITSPSAKDGADGGSGIINIILKKDLSEGWKGSILLSVANRDRYTISPSISYRKDDLNFFLRYSQLKNTRRTESTGLETRNDTIQLDQIGNSIFKDLRNNIEFGADYFFNKRKYLTISGLYRYRDKKSGQTQFSEVSRNMSLEELRNTTNSEPESNDGYEVVLSYISENEEQTKSTELYLDVSHSVEEERIIRVDDLTDASTNQMSYEGGLSNYVDVNDGIFFDASLTRPLWKGRLDFGVRYFYRDIEQTFDLRLTNPESGVFLESFAQNDRFVYSDHVSATYGEVEQNFDRFKFGAGLRVEYSINDYTSESLSRDFSNSFLNLFPSAKLGYKITDNSSVQLNYSRRINRPSPNRLNPFPSLANPFQIDVGNPNLSPEYINSFNFGYSKDFEESSVIFNLFWKKYNDLIQRISMIEEDGTRTISPVNLDKLNNYGFDFTYSLDVTDFWSVNAGFVFFKNDFSSVENAVESSGFTQQYKATSNLEISDKLDWQVVWYYNSAEVGPQGEMKEQHYADTGWNYKMFEGKARFTLSISDIFNTIKEINIIDIENLQSRSSRKVDTHILRLSFSYKF